MYTVAIIIGKYKFKSKTVGLANVSRKGVKFAYDNIFAPGALTTNNKQYRGVNAKTSTLLKLQIKSFYFLCYRCQDAQFSG